jgi:hypothetical protein
MAIASDPTGHSTADARTPGTSFVARHPEAAKERRLMPGELRRPFRDRSRARSDLPQRPIAG